jgi:hypothetical protein
MIQPVVITYWFGSAECYARVETSQTVTWDEAGNASTERSPDYTLACVGLAPDAEADFRALYAAGQATGAALDDFLATHALTLGVPDAI